MNSRKPRVWPWAIGGALVLLLWLLLANLGDYEGSDSIVFLAPVVLLAGSAIGSLVGLTIRGLRGARAQADR